ncbi:MAG: hypothetical protein D6706_13050, partial [Chloroflexi bacterium]
AEETQSDEPLATAHMLLGLVSYVQESDVMAAADHFAEAVRLAWEYHAVTGQRINRAILRHLEEWKQAGEVKASRTICTFILQNGRQRLGNDYPEALQEFESFCESSLKLKQFPGDDTPTMVINETSESQ